MDKISNEKIACIVLLFALSSLSGCSGSSSSSNDSTTVQTTPPSNTAQTTDELQVRQVQEGNPAHHGGSPTIRKAFVPQRDNPATTNDESNDQPIGHFGKRTIMVTNISSGNSYPLDADIEDGQVKRLYFEKGGWVDFDGAEIDEDGKGEGTDEEGREWQFEGYTD